MRIGQETELREAALACSLAGLQCSPSSALSFSSLTGSRASVAARCSDMLFGLQLSFPATIHNVVRTARKLDRPRLHEQRPLLGLCALCAALLPGPARGAASGAGELQGQGQGQGQERGGALALCEACCKLLALAPGLQQALPWVPA